MRTFFVCLLSLAPSIALAAPEQLNAKGTETPMSAIAAAASFHPDTIAAKGLRADPNAVNAISRDEICNTVAAAAQAHDIPVAFFTSLIWQESGFRAEAVSPVGAQGVAQFMPRVAEAMGLDNPFDPLQALPMSARLLRTLFNQFGNFGLAAAAYNAGPARVLNWLNSKKKAQLPKETRDYVMAITGREADQWRGGMSKVEFHAPPRTRCHVIASRAERSEGEYKVVDLANIPLPRQRPSATELEQVPEIAVAEAPPRKHHRVKTAAAAAPVNPVAAVVAAVARTPERIAKTIATTVKVLAPEQRPMRLASAPKIAKPKVAKTKIASAASAKTAHAVPKVKSGKRVRVAKAD